MEATRKPTEPILHADLDAFYASVETLKDPSLAGKAVVVGSAGPPGEVIDFLHPLPVRALWGVGEKTAETLDRLAIRLVGDVARTPAPILERVLGEGQAATLRALASGEDARIVVPFEAPKSVSHEET